MKLFLAIITVVFPLLAHSSEIGLGPHFSIPTSKVDHLKWGGRFNFSIDTSKTNRFWGSFQMGIASFTAVNPGAGGSQSIVTSNPVLTGAFYQFDSTLLGGKLSAGIQGYYSDLGSYSSAVPAAPTIHLAWSLWPGNFSGNLNGSFGFNLMNFKPASLLETIELEMSWSLGKSLRLQFSPQIWFAQQFGSGSPAYLIHPAFSISANLLL